MHFTSPDEDYKAHIGEGFYDIENEDDIEKNTSYLVFSLESSMLHYYLEQESLSRK